MTEDPDPLERWIITEQEWVLIPVTPVEPDETSPLSIR